MMPAVERALDLLLYELHTQVFGQSLPQQYDVRRALLEAPLPSAERPGRVTYRGVSVCGGHTCGNASDCSIFPRRRGPL
jgi:hypothetical protein